MKTEDPDSIVWDPPGKGATVRHTVKPECKPVNQPPWYMRRALVKEAGSFSRRIDEQARPPVKGILVVGAFDYGLGEPVTREFLIPTDEMAPVGSHVDVAVFVEGGALTLIPAGSNVTLQPDLTVK